MAFLVFDVIMLIWDRIVRRKGEEKGVKSDLRASGSARASYKRGVGFSNFVLRAREMHSRSHAAANASFSGSPGFSGRYYAMDVKSEATPKRRVKRRPLFISPVTRFSMHGFTLLLFFFCFFSFA